MSKNNLLLKAFLHKSRDGVIIIFTFVFIIALLLNLFFMLFFDYQKNFDRYHEKLNSEDNIFVFNSLDISSLKSGADSYFSENQQVADYEGIDVFALGGNCDYDGEKLETNFVGIRLSDAMEKRIGKYEIVSEDESIEGVLLPYIFNASHNYNIGDSFTLITQSGEFSCKVRGFYVSTMNSSQNCVMVALLYSDSVYESAINTLGYERVMYSVILNDSSYASAFLACVNNDLGKIAEDVSIDFNNCLQSTRVGRYVVATICTAIISAASGITLIISVIVVTYNILSYINDNISMFGTFKAIGYKTNNIIFPFVLLFFLLSLAASIAGGACSYAVFPFINRVLTTQVGLPYEMRLLVKPYVITVLFLTAAVTLTAFLNLKKIGSILPIHAIRRVKRKAQKHKLGMEKSKASINAALSFRYMLANTKQNIVLIITVSVVSLLTVFSVVFLENIIINDTDLAYLVFGEFCDSSVTVYADDKDALKDFLEKDDRVENVLGYYSQDVSNEDKGNLVVKVIDSADNITNDNYCYKGCLPTDADSAALGGKYAKEQNLSIGDSITVSVSGKEKTFEICGFVQGAEFLGKDFVITQDAFEEFADMPYYRYYIVLSDGVDIDEFNSEIKEQFPASYTVNKLSYLKSMEKSYFTAIKIISVAVLVVSFCIILFVLYVVTRKLLERKKRDNGIMKAIGYSSKQLIAQTVYTYLPIIFLTSLIGTFLSCFAVNPVMSLLMQGIGIERCAFRIPVLDVLLSALFISIASCFFIMLLSAEIKKIVPHRLLTRE